MDSLERTIRLCAQLGVGAVTIYAFSTENWQRPKREVDFLMHLIEKVRVSCSAMVLSVASGLLGDDFWFGG